MNSNLSIVIALFAGLAGGLLTRYIAPTPVFAQAPNAQAPAGAAVPNELRARSLTLIDQNDRPVGTFTAEPLTPDYLQRAVPPMRIVLRDAAGHQIWSAGGSTIRPLSASVK